MILDISESTKTLSEDFDELYKSSWTLFVAGELPNFRSGGGGGILSKETQNINYQPAALERIRVIVQ